MGHRHPTGLQHPPTFDVSADSENSEEEEDEKTMSLSRTQSLKEVKIFTKKELSRFKRRLADINNQLLKLENERIKTTVRAEELYK